jgi:hypothetical protein
MSEAEYSPLVRLYADTTENECHNEHSGHKPLSDECIFARDQYEMKYKQLNKGGG